jgi:2-aminomuconate deaminase
MNQPTGHGQVIGGMATPRGAYSHIRRAGDFLFVSGTSARQSDNTIAGASADAMGTLSLDIVLQTRAVLHSMQRILATAGATLDDVVDVSSFLVNMNDFGGYNDEYARWFGPGGPTRTTVAVHQLPHPQLLIEIKCVAHKPLPPGERHA